MSALILDQDEVQELTGYKRPSRQHIELNRMGIEHKVRADGFPIVSRRVCENILGGNTTQKTAASDWTPDFDCLQG